MPSICLAQGTSLWNGNTWTPSLYMTSALDTTTSSSAEMTTTTSHMNGTEFTLLLVFSEIGLTNQCNLRFKVR